MQKLSSRGDSKMLRRALLFLAIMAAFTSFATDIVTPGSPFTNHPGDFRITGTFDSVDPQIVSVYAWVAASDESFVTSLGGLDVSAGTLDGVPWSVSQGNSLPSGVYHA